MSSIMRWRNGLMGLSSIAKAPVSHGVQNPMILRQSDASRCPGLQPLTLTLAAHRESGLVRRREADIAGPPIHHTQALHSHPPQPTDHPPPSTLHPRGPSLTANALVKRVVAGTWEGVQPDPGHPPPMLSLWDNPFRRQLCIRAGTLGELRQVQSIV